MAEEARVLVGAEPEAGDTSSDEDSYDPEDDLPLCIRHQKTFNAIALLLYVALGVSMLSLYEQWSFVTSFYVIVQIVTTVGYGDIAPSRSGELFLAFYVMLGTVLVASILNSLIESIVEASQAELADSLKETRDSVVRSISRNKIFSSKVLSMYWKRTPVANLVRSAVVYLLFLAGWVAFFALYERCSCSYGATRVEGCLDGDNCTETGGVQLSFEDAFYMGVITFSTVGFGDFSPKSELGRIFGSIWMILGIITFGNMVSNVSSVLSEWRSYYKRRILVSRELFNKIDRDKSGRIRRNEFLQYMLVRQGLVKVEALDDINTLFDALDKDQSGILTFDEINGILLPLEEA